MSSPLITIVTVVLNDYKNIERTILSVLNQTYSNIQYLVMDGASTDGTTKVLKKYSDRLFYLSEKDNGIYDAMNKSLNLAKGEWILFMNCGDIFYDENVIQKVFSTYIDEGESLICGDVIYKYPNRKSVLIKSSERVKENKYMPSCHQAMFTRLSCLKEANYETRYRIISDFIFCYDLYMAGKNFLLINDIIAVYDATGISSNVSLRKKEMSHFYLRKKKYFKAYVFFFKYLHSLVYDIIKIHGILKSFI
ncbi:MAG: glycosyltransferase [Bacteroidetes bacterium HGW-Bacteroidetes-5]|jgi:glycosyltransferase involved in cell wall biosynthesis|nr:MAG: glycosyltransferase [Bacteroidetes bacterium HGW-Bacteroidetes-5]